MFTVAARPTTHDPAAPLVQIENVHKSFFMGKSAVHALRGVNLEVMPGEFLCLMGPSGSGKTTLLNIIGGLEEPSQGRVHVAGRNLSSLSERELAEMRLTQIGFVFQSYNLLANFTALENVQAPMALAGVRKREREQKATELLRWVGLEDRASHYPSELSGGQQQRVAIARAMANNPMLLIGDEITGDLDSDASSDVMHWLANLNRELGITIIFVTHDDRLREFAHRTLQLLDGKIVEHAQPTPLATEADRLSLSPNDNHGQDGGAGESTAAAGKRHPGRKAESGALDKQRAGVRERGS